MTKVLVVDDSMTIRSQVSRALGGAGFAVLEAADGVEALASLEAHPDVKLVVCDINMPNMTGLELVERLRLEPARAGLAVVMLTTEGHNGLVQRAKAAGARGWIMKPFKPEHVIAAARKLTAA